jgi:Ca2+-binding EF-hand superfamily protein
MEDKTTVPEYLQPHYRELFNEFDKNKSGYLELKEVSTALRKCLQDLGENEIKKTIDEVSNRYKMVDYNTFSSIIYKKTKGIDIADEVISAFKVFDKNDKGIISVNELRGVLTTIGDALTQKEIDAMINEADVDGDGNINYEEFVRGMMSR